VTQAAGATKAAAELYAAGHLAALTELSHELAAIGVEGGGGGYPILNHFGVSGPVVTGFRLISTTFPLFCRGRCQL
jgi:hypothetical protein